MNYWSRVLEEVKQRNNGAYEKCFVHFPDAPLAAQSSKVSISSSRYYLGPYFPKVYLTQREYECVLGILKCMTYRRIALVMGVSRRTVECYVKTIKEKLSCQSREELMRVIAKSDLL